MKVIVAGGRDFIDYQLLKSKCDLFLKNQSELEIISGTANGADKLGEKYAREKGYKLTQFPANWSLGKKAGYIRNKQMAEYSDCLIAFWNCKSKGTEHMVNLAKELGLKVRIVKY